MQTAALLGYQKSLDELCNPEELQFQIVHPGEELWMKLLAYTLLDIDEHLFERAPHRAVMLFGRCHRLLRLLLIHRSTGMGAASLKGRSVDLLAAGAKHRSLPELWDSRADDGPMRRRLWPHAQIAVAPSRCSCPTGRLAAPARASGFERERCEARVPVEVVLVLRALQESHDFVGQGCCKDFPSGLEHVLRHHDRHELVRAP